ncbi:MAG: DUF190 domain-containing protein [Solirubrobacteraceae bacterium]
MTGEPCLKLTVYLGDRDRDGHRLLADAVLERFAQHGVQAGVLLRGIEGFGIKHRLHTERLLTLSEDLPVLAIAIGAPTRIEALLADVESIARHGLLTLERARLLGRGQPSAPLPQDGSPAKLTILLGRHQRVGGESAHVAAVACLRRHGLLGANVLLGLDGTVRGERRRARFLARNQSVPVMILAVGEGGRVAAALPELWAMLGDAQMALERVQVCKRDGRLIGPPIAPPRVIEEGIGYWQKLTVYTGEQARHGHEPLHGALVRRLRLAGAAGATTLRGQWGFHGDHEPHGERFWSIVRHTPLQTVVLDTPANIARWFSLVDELTVETGLVTCEAVPALRAAGPRIEHGGTRLAEPADAWR